MRCIAARCSGGSFAMRACICLRMSAIRWAMASMVALSTTR
jgi:hypothetical protein